MKLAVLSARAGAGLARAVRAVVGRPLAWIAAVVLLASWPIVWSVRTRVPPPPPVFGAVPEFQLLDQDSRAFGSRDLAGRVWIASFVFTRCSTACPEITRQMARIQGRARNLEPALHLVSFTVDPEHDTPARLATYARAHRASPRMWTFVAGPSAPVRDVVEEGVPEKGAPATAVLDAGAAPQPTHGRHLVLVDGAARIRGYYDPLAPDTVDRIVRDAALLVNRR